MASVWVYGVHKSTIFRLQRLVAELRRLVGAPFPGARGCAWQRRNAACGQLTFPLVSMHASNVPRLGIVEAE
jgi:hypothetical protein